MKSDRTALGLRLRYSGERLPPYSHVPGFTPHPVSDALGHMHGAVHQPPEPIVPASWQSSPAYRFAVDLFNYGFYWEAHEAWESLWHAAGRRGVVAAWLKALIKLAAAGVKAREGNAVGVERHARRALELLADVRRDLPAGQGGFAGISLAHVEGVANSLLKDAHARFASPQPELLLTEWLPLGDS